MAEIISLFPSSKEKAKKIFMEALQSLSYQSYLDAAEKFDDVCNLDQENPEYYYYSAVTNYLIGNEKKAEDRLKKAIQLDPMSEYQHLLGIIFYNQKKIEESQILFKEAYKKEPDRIESGIYLSKCLNRKNEYKQAIQILKEIQVKTNRHDVLYELGRNYYDSFCYELAEEHILACLKKIDYYEAYILLWNIYLSMGKHNKATEILSLMKSKYPEEENSIEERIKITELLTNL